MYIRLFLKILEKDLDESGIISRKITFYDIINFFRKRMERIQKNDSIYENKIDLHVLFSTCPSIKKKKISHYTVLKN